MPAVTRRLTPASGAACCSHPCYFAAPELGSPNHRIRTGPTARCSFPRILLPTFDDEVAVGRVDFDDARLAARAKPGRRCSEGPKPTRRAPLSEPSALARKIACAQSSEPPDTDPYVRWCGRGRSREALPYPDLDDGGAATSMRERHELGVCSRLGLGHLGSERLRLLRQCLVRRATLSAAAPFSWF
jgi:hypothetical protein